MHAADGPIYYVITVRGERGPVRRQDLSTMLQSGEILAEDQIRNAFGRRLGTVREVLAARPRASSQVDEPLAAPASRSPALIVAAALVLVLIAVLTWMVWPSPVVATVPVPATTPEPAPPPALNRERQVDPPQHVPEAAVPPASTPPGAICTTYFGKAEAVAEFQEHDEVLSKAFDGNTQTKWLVPLPPRDVRGPVMVWLRLLPEPARRRIVGYALTSANDAADRDPASWILVGISSDGTDHVIDRRNREVWDQRLQRREFRLAVPAEYPAYRLDVIRIRNTDSEDLFQVAEVELLWP